MAKRKIYMIRGYVCHRTKSGARDVEEETTRIFVGNLEMAESAYKSAENRVKSFSYLTSYTGRAELFVPDIDTTTGEMLHFPKDKYLKEYTLGE